VQLTHLAITRHWATIEVFAALAVVGVNRTSHRRSTGWFGCLRCWKRGRRGCGRS
jgi:hypothetical protein